MRGAGRDQVAGADRGEHDARGERGQPAALLQVEREDEEERRLAGPEHKLREQPGSERPLPEQRRIDQRRPAARGDPVLVPRERGKQHAPAGQAGPGPGRPARLAALDQRQHDRDQGHARDHHARDAQRGAGWPAGLGHHPRGQRHRGRADRHVDQEAGPPVESEHVRPDQQAADELAGHRADAQAQPEHAERPGLGLARVAGSQDRQNLRRHQPGGNALQHPARDQQAGRGRQAAGRRRNGEQDEADGEHPPPAERVAEPARGDQDSGHGQAEPGDHPLDGRSAGVQLALQ